MSIENKLTPNFKSRPGLGPCFFYNTGGCYNKDGSVKTQDQCKYQHILVDYPMEKGQHLKAPCKYYHLRGFCKNPYCLFGHLELSNEKWGWYFPQHAYPGKNYSKNYKWNTNS